ncbi:MAG: hypothetical protein ACYTFA_01065 [Planctomycetota bacterium]
MTGIVRKVAAFVRWLFASEQLPAWPGEGQAAGEPGQSFVRWVVSGDELGSDGPGKTQRAAGRRFLRWVLSPERLSDQPGEPGRGGKPGVSFLRWALRGEELPELKVPNASDARQPTFLGWVLSPEVCPTNREPTPRRRSGLLRWTPSSDVCPTAEPSTRERGGTFLGSVFASEDCPVDKAPTPERRPGFLRWLTSRERLKL